jgi:hypothetical protein
VEQSAQIKSLKQAVGGCEQLLLRLHREVMPPGADGYRPIQKHIPALALFGSHIDKSEEEALHQWERLFV